MAEQEKKDKVRVTGLKVFIKTLLHGDVVAMEEAFRKEAARQVGEMVKWMDDQEMNDPSGMLWQYEDDLFPLVKKAQKYQARIYNRNKLVTAVRNKMIVLVANKEGLDSADLEKAKDTLQEEWMTIEDEQMALCWRIRKIYAHVTKEVRLNLEEDELDPFEDYEYDPEEAG